MGLTLKYEFTNGNKQDIHFDNDDKTRVNNIHSWGFVKVCLDLHQAHLIII